MENYNFNQAERDIFAKFNILFLQDIELLSRLFKHLESLIIQLNRKIYSNDSVNYTIQLFLANNITLLYNSYDRLEHGYLGISLALLRPTLESISLSMYFHEFPEDTEIYKEEPKKLYKKITKLKFKTISDGKEVVQNYLPWIEGLLQRIDHEGNKFIQREDMEGETWYRFIFKNLMDDASLFLHANSDSIYSVVYGGEEGGILQYKYGPNWQGDMLMKNALWKIIETTLFNTIVLDSIFKQYIEQNDLGLIQEVTGRLNKWKNSYSDLIKTNNQ